MYLFNSYEVVGWTHGTFRVVNDRILKTKVIHGKDRDLSLQEFRDKVRASARGEKVEWETPPLNATVVEGKSWGKVKSSFTGGQR